MSCITCHWQRIVLAAMLEMFSDLFGVIRAMHQLRPRRVGRREDIQRIQQRRLRELLTHARAASPFYRKRLGSLDIERCATADLPVLTKRDMMDNFDELVTDRTIKKRDVEAFVADERNLGRYFLGRYGVCHTSGTQGQPALIVHDKSALMLNFTVQFARGAAVQNRKFPHFEHLFEPARLALITQRPGFYPSGAAFAYLPAGLEPFFKILKLSVFDPIGYNVARLNEFRPHYISGYTSFFETLAREELEGRLRMRGSALKQIINISEVLPKEIASSLQAAFRVSVTNIYAMGECLALSSGCTISSGTHINADLALLEITDDLGRPVPEGTKGAKVYLTNLYNKVQPIIRYEIDDIVTLSAQPCACGSPLPLIQSIEGRSTDRLWILRDGHYEELPYFVFLGALHNCLNLAEHQVVQTGLNTFLVKAAPQPGKALTRERLMQLILHSIQLEHLEDIVRFDIEIVSGIERGPSGKAIRVKNRFGPPPAPPAGQPHHA
ncbi:MAG TPA: AMP-binding protein [Hyphomicrobium sp.]|nr:AMP-binding protein [Hyphomicrobium sp.]